MQPINRRQFLISSVATVPVRGLRSRHDGPWDLEKLSVTPKVGWGEQKDLVRSLFYEGEPYRGQPTRIFAYYGAPVRHEGKLPAMVLVHGGGGSAFFDWAELWARRGYAAIAMDLTGRGADRKRLPDGGPDQGLTAKFDDIKNGVKDAWPYHAIANVIRAVSLLRSLPNVDPERIGITGISWGGYLTCIMAGLDTRLKVAVPLHGCGFLHENSDWLGDFERLGPELTRLWVENFDPSRYLAGARMPVLFLNGTNDSAYPLDSYQKSYRLVPSRTLSVTPRMPHGHPQGWAPKEIGIFADSVLRGGIPLPAAVKMSRQGTRITVECKSQTAIKVAQLHYSRDVGDWKNWKTQKWESVGAEVAGHIVRAALPSDKTLVYFLTMQDERGATVSTEHEEIGPAAKGESPCEKLDLFEAGQEGFQAYRIPALVVTSKGTVLAFTSARTAVSDWSDTAIMMRRSTDGGRTWFPRRVIAESGTSTVDNPVPIVDRQTGVVHFLYQVNYARCYYMRSDDDGQTFSEPVDVTGTFEQYRPDYDWSALAPGPGHGIQLRSGRLLVPVWLSDGGRHSHRPSCVSAVHSDDHGKTWIRSDIVVRTTEVTPNPSESVAVELFDGRVMLNIRCEARRYRRLVAFSPDGGDRWGRAKFDEGLFDPICFASLVRVPGDCDGQPGSLVFVNPNPDEGAPVVSDWGARPRENLTVRMSRDEGKTWVASKLLEPGRTGYSDLAVLPDGTILCLYQRGTGEGHDLNARYLTVARLKPGWLEQANDK